MEEQGEKTASGKCFREAGVCSQRRHRLGDHRMMSYELSYELRSGEDSLERKTEERQLAELGTV